MTDENENNEEEVIVTSEAPKEPDSDITSEENELELLHNRADLMGIKYHHKAGVATLRRLIKERLDDETKINAEEVIKEVEEEKVVVAIKPTFDDSPLARKNRTIKAKKLEATKLMRVIIHSNDPKKKDWMGEYFTVSNRIVGTIKKFVPYDNEAGWHIPYILYTTLKEKEVQLFRTTKNHRGEKFREGYLAKAYNIIDLDALNAEELEELASAQAARGSIDQ